MLALSVDQSDGEQILCDHNKRLLAALTIFISHSCFVVRSSYYTFSTMESSRQFTGEVEAPVI